ncbi:hypothetical protein [Paenibacillus sp. y28]|uniref:hypothetical protein n=1 Tax=Paenibacillus sp. y28 TaxID=3129110 RepID=UPI00301A6E44
MMESRPLLFEFAEEVSAQMAQTTLQELGYHVHQGTGEGGGLLKLWVENNDLVSALEITQSHGGTLLERTGSAGGHSAGVLNSVYDLDSLPIPAHLVQEEEAESSLPEASSASPQGAASL